MIPPEGRSEPCHRRPWAAPPRAHAPTRRPWPSFFKLEEASISILSDDDALINPKAEFVIPGLVQKRKSAGVLSRLHENPVKGWREGADPRGHRHRLGCRARTRPLTSAIGSARIRQPSTLSDNRGSSALSSSQSSRNRPGPKRFEDRDSVREGCAPLSTLGHSGTRRYSWYLVTGASAGGTRWAKRGSLLVLDTALAGCLLRTDPDLRNSLAGSLSAVSTTRVCTVLSWPAHCGRTRSMSTDAVCRTNGAQGVLTGNAGRREGGAG